MILLLPLLFSFILYIIKIREENNILIKYSIFILFLYFFNITIGINNLFIYILIIILYWLYLENLKFFTYFFIINSIFIFYSNSLYAIFISIELISFIMITFINLYINNKLPGILYFLFSGIFTGIFILSLGYIYIGENIAYSLISLVFIWKLGLGPLHILIPNIYNSLSPNKIIFIDIINKYLLFYVLYRLLFSININLYFIIFLSIIIGTLSILNTSNLLNIIIFSSITNYGLILILINNFNIFFIYLIFYIFMILIYFYLIIHIHIHYSINNFYYILMWGILLFNFIGIPPLTGFWIKLYILNILINNNLYIILFFTIISFIFLAGVYLKILLAFWLNPNSININLINNNNIITHFISSILLLLTFPIIFI